MGWSVHHPTGLIHYAPQHSYRGYTLITGSGGHHAQLVDMEGRVCHRWHSDEGISYAYLLPNGNLLMRPNRPSAGAAATSGQQPATGAGGGATAVGAVLELDWDGHLVWSYRDPMLHHDYERLPNGNTLVLLFEEVPSELAQQVKGGFTTDDGPGEMLGDVVKEVTPNGEIVHQWRAWEHLDIEQDAICPLEGRGEWTHQNALNVTSDGDLLVSFRQTSTVGIVDRVSGAFKWKWGPGEISHQHHPTHLENGNVLLFDNGPHRRGVSYSRIVEVDPATSEIAWEYRGEPPISFFSYHISGAERLPNGNTLITEGAPGRIFEVTPNGEIVWEYMNPFAGTGAGGPGRTPPGQPTSVFRAHRYGPDHLALQGRELDPERYANLNRLYEGRPNSG